jgi:hypothetical protein
VICYRHHPLYGSEVAVVRYLRRTADAKIVIIRRVDGMQFAVPEWMLNATVCADLTDETEPRIALGALRELRHLIDTLRGDSGNIACDERTQFSSGGENAEARERANTKAPRVRHRRGVDQAAGGSSGELPKALFSTAGRRADSDGKER